MTLTRYGRLEDIPPERLDPSLREQALLFRQLATLRTDIALFESVDELEWKSVRPEFAALASRFDSATTAKSKEPAARS